VLAAGPGDTDVVLITALGQDRLGSRLRDLLSPHVQVMALPLQGGTPCKIRVQASGQPVVRLDAGDGRPCSGRVSPQAERALRQAGAVLVADYGRGMAAHPGLAAMLSRLTAATPVVWDPHPAGARPLPGSRLVTPSQLEAGRFASDLNGDRNGTVGPGSALASAARDLGQPGRHHLG
jgi:bifunctional ADP-heptose synthase (sugar kinase/adenylyltransferase)